MKHYRLLAALALAGCGAMDPDAAFTNPDCRTAMYADPAVRDATVQVAVAGAAAQGQELPTLLVAKQRAYNACLRDKGLLRGGGVQPVKK